MPRTHHERAARARSRPAFATPRARPHRSRPSTARRIEGQLDRLLRTLDFLEHLLLTTYEQKAHLHGVDDDREEEEALELVAVDGTETLIVSGEKSEYMFVAGTVTRSTDDETRSTAPTSDSSCGTMNWRQPVSSRASWSE